MNSCPNCQQPVPIHATFCPNCGFVLTPPLAQELLLTNIRWLDIVLGAGLGLVSPFVMLIGFIAAIVFYFVLRKTYAAFAKGMLIGLIAITVLFLGGLALCIGLIASGPH